MATLRTSTTRTGPEDSGPTGAGPAGPVAPDAPSSTPEAGAKRERLAGRSGALSRVEAWFLHASNLLVGGTGLAYGWMSYLLEPADEWALVNHPWQPDVQHLHVLTAPLLVFAVGLIWRDHVWGRIRRGVRARRRAGLSLALSFLPMAASGYLVQVATDEGWRLVWVWVHGATSLLWIGGYAVHQLARKRARRSSTRA